MHQRWQTIAANLNDPPPLTEASTLPTMRLEPVPDPLPKPTDTLSWALPNPSVG